MVNPSPKTLIAAFKIFRSQRDLRRQQERMAADMARMIGRPCANSVDEILSAIDDHTRDHYRAWALLMQVLGCGPVSAETEPPALAAGADAVEQTEANAGGSPDPELLALLRQRGVRTTPPDPNHPR